VAAVLARCRSSGSIADHFEVRSTEYAKEALEPSEHDWCSGDILGVARTSKQKTDGELGSAAALRQGPRRTLPGLTALGQLVILGRRELS
jgi:hypothetical protein